MSVNKLAETAAIRAAAERGMQIKEMMKKNLVIPVEDPVEVARRYRKSKRKRRLPALAQEKQEKADKMEDENIRKKGVYLIKDKELKTVKMPRFIDFRTNKEPKPTQETKEDEIEDKGIKRHINVGATNPLGGAGITSPKKTKTKKKKPKTSRD